MGIKKCFSWNRPILWVTLFVILFLGEAQAGLRVRMHQTDRGLQFEICFSTEKCLVSQFNRDGELEWLDMSAPQDLRFLSNQDVSHIHKVVNNGRSQFSGDSETELLLQVVDKFLPVNEVFAMGGLSWTARPRKPSTQAPAWTLLCGQMGEMVTAEYEARGTVYHPQVVLGDPSQRCRGRCGKGCGWGHWGGHTYTQECLNHDMCHTIEGTQLGECTEELRDAVASYLFAPAC